MQTKTAYRGVYYRERKGRYKGRPDKVFEYCFQEDGKKKWRTAGRASDGMTAKRASQMREKHIALLEAPAIRPGKAFTIGQAADLVLKDARARGVSPESYRPLESKLRNHILPHARVKISDINKAWLEKFKAELSRTLSPYSMRMVAGHLRKGINLGIRQGLWTGRNPLSADAGFSIPAKETKCERYLAKEEAERLLAELSRSSPYWHDMAAVSLQTGARCTELFKMRARDVPNEPGPMRIIGKFREPEQLYLTPRALEILKARAESAESPDALLFPRRGSEPFKNAADRLGLNSMPRVAKDKVWFHTMRHTFASWLAQGGADIYTIQKLLRHRKREEPQRYAHLCPAVFDKALEIIPPI